MAEVLSGRAINRATLVRQSLLSRQRFPVTEAVGRLFALQAQEPRPPFVSLWSRLAEFSADDLRRALARREVVRATHVRGTLHLITADDYLAFRALVEPTLATAATSVIGRLPGPAPDPERLLPAARAALAGGPLDFAAVRERMRQEFPDVNDRALGYLVRMRLPLVMVPTDDPWAFPGTARFTLAESWLGAAPAAESSPETFVTRYLAAFGPATARDMQTFSGLRLGEAIERLRPALREFADERGRALFDLPEAPRPDEDVEAPARFLPDFDSLLLAHDDRTRIVPAEHRSRLATRNLRVPAVFLWDGLVRGAWKVTRRRSSAILTMTPFERLTRKAVTELSAEADRLLGFTDPDAGTREVRLAPED